MRSIDLTGERFGKLTVIKRSPTKYDAAYWLCFCDCGRIASHRTYDLTSGRVKTCGCGQGKRSHGLSREKGKHSNLYAIWVAMRQRCQNPKDRNYKHYGERGIKICPEWDKYTTFHNWAMENGYNPGLSIERIDNDGGYSPNNCKWIHRGEQSKNTRRVRHITHNGITKNLREWGRHTGINPRTIASRIDHGWSLESALHTQVQRR